ncbi:MAG: lysophospholipid acyltransferase family protein [Candidatus Coprovivens sp.]
MKEPLLYCILRPIITLLVKLVFRPTYIGLENIPKSGRVVLAGNHTNNFDSVLLISSTKRIVHFLAKDSLTKGPLGPIFKAMGIIPVNRSIHDKNALKSAINTLEQDKVIGIFPEGTINRTNDIIMPFKIGAVKMSKETNSQIVPFIITGKYKIFKKSVTIEFLEPIEIKSDNLTKENERLMKTISTKLEEKRS